MQALHDEQQQQHYDNEVWRQSSQHEHEVQQIQPDLVEDEQTHDYQQLIDLLDEQVELQHTTHKIHNEQDEHDEFVHVDHYITRYLLQRWFTQQPQ